MTALNVRANLDLDPWTDLQDIGLDHGELERIGLLPRGMVSGRASVALAVRLDDGNVVVAECSLANFRLAATFLLAGEIAQAEA